MNNAFTIGRLFGIQIRIHFTWFIIFALVTVSLVNPDWSQPLVWVLALIASLLFFASVLGHELAHSLVGRAEGVTVSSITLFLFGGVAQMDSEAKKAGAEFRMAAAGPAASLLIGGLFGLVWFLSRDSLWPVVSDTLWWLALINGLLALFNLIPGFPLDGGRVLRSVLWRTSGNYGRATRIATRLGQVVGYLFILGGLAMILFMHNYIGGVWLAFVGWFLDNAASASHRQERWREALQGYTATDVMTQDYAAVAAGITVGELVRAYVLPGGRRFFLVIEDGRLEGMVTLHNIKSVPQAEWDATPLRRVITPAGEMRIARPEQDALSVMEMMGESDVNQVPVVSGGEVLGVVSRDNLLRFLRTRSELRV